MSDDQPPAAPPPSVPPSRSGRPQRERDEPALPDVTRDERDVGWGDEPGERSDDWYRRERPPHHE